MGSQLGLSDPAGVVVVGMHRSGTSTVTRVINLLGLPLGREDDLYTAPDNPSGHWESIDLCNTNDAILETFGGYDMAPPHFPSGWANSVRAVHLRPSLRRVFDGVYDRPNWVWKDPRLSLTLPIWRTVLPPTVAVLVIRNPADVARSLAVRDPLRPFFCYALWEWYNQAVLVSMAGMPMVIVNFDDLRSDPAAVTERVHGALRDHGLPVDARQVAEAASSVHPGTAVIGTASLDRMTNPLWEALRDLPAVSDSFSVPAGLGQPSPWADAALAYRRYRIRASDASRRRRSLAELRRWHSVAGVF